MVSRQRGYFRRVEVNLTLVGMLVAVASFSFAALLHATLGLNLVLWTVIFDLACTAVFFFLHWRS